MDVGVVSGSKRKKRMTLARNGWNNEPNWRGECVRVKFVPPKWVAKANENDTKNPKKRANYLEYCCAKN